MTVWALVPVKPFALAKSRLAGVLPPAGRAALSRRLLSRTLTALAAATEIQRVVVISRDRAALGLARRAGTQALRETGAAGLNAALEQALAQARAAGAEAALILPADLPHLTPDDIVALLPPGSDPALVIAPDRHERGTNALLMRPPGLIACAFGEGSFAAHLARARAAGVTPQVCRRPKLALDLDTPEDLLLSQVTASALQLLP